MLQKSVLEEETLVWINAQGEKIIYYLWDTKFEPYSKYGLSSPYEFEKIIWNAGMYQAMPLILKSFTVPKGCSAVYHLETGRLNAIIITGNQSSGEKYVEFMAFPNSGKRYFMTTLAPTLAEAVQPVILTVERLLKE